MLHNIADTQKLKNIKTSSHLMQLTLIRVVVDHQVEGASAGEGTAAVPNKQIQRPRAVEVFF